MSVYLPCSCACKLPRGGMLENISLNFNDIFLCILAPKPPIFHAYLHPPPAPTHFFPWPGSEGPPPLLELYRCAFWLVFFVVIIILLITRMSPIPSCLRGSFWDCVVAAFERAACVDGLLAPHLAIQNSLWWCFQFSQWCSVMYFYITIVLFWFHFLLLLCPIVAIVTMKKALCYCRFIAIKIHTEYWFFFFPECKTNYFLHLW